MDSTLRSTQPVAGGSVFGTYRVEGDLGRGANAQVFRALCTDSGELIALKVARDKPASELLASEQAALEQLARAPHPGVVRLRNAGTHIEQRWLALECLMGGNLRRRCERSLSLQVDGLEEAVRTGVLLAEALGYVHSLGLVHGDLSPANVLFRAEQPVLIDWTMARSCPNAQQLKHDNSQDHGTVGYLAPERLRAESYDSRSDLYALGCLLFELFCGRPPFVSDSVAALARSHLFAEPPPPSRFAAWLPPDVDALVLALLEKEPRKRLPYALLAAQRLGAEPLHARCTVPIFRPRLIEQELHLSDLAAPLRDAQSQLSMLIVYGDPGSGRTRLLEELAEVARNEACLSIHLRMGGASALRPLAALDPLLEELAKHLSTDTTIPAEVHPLVVLRAHSAALTAVIEDSGPVEPQLSLDSSRERVYTALLAGLELLARARPVCLFVDTLESESEVVGGFLGWLRGHIGRALACRVVIATSLQRFDATLFPGADVQRIAALSERNVARLLGELVAHSVDASELASFVHKLTGGIPAQVVELVTRIIRALAFQLDNVRGGVNIDLERTRELARTWEALPESLTSQAASIATIAATHGRSIDLALLDRVLQEVRPELLPADAGLRELLMVGILSRDETGYRFAHEFQRRWAAAAAPEAERRRFHRGFALAIAARPFRARDHLSVGRHWEAAGEPRRAIAALSFGARRAARTLAVREALSALELALQLATASEPPVWSARAVRLGLTLVELLSVVGDHARLAQVAEQLNSFASATACYARARSALLLAQSARVVGDYSTAERALSQSDVAVPEARQTSSTRLNGVWLDTQVVGAFTAYTRRDLPTMRRRLNRLAAPVRQWGTSEQRAEHLVWRANYLVLKSRYAFNPLSVRLERHASRILTRVASRSSEAIYCQFDLAFMLLLGDALACREASDLLFEAERAVKRLGDNVLLARIATYQTIAQRRLRDTRRCEQYANLALPLAKECGLRGYVGAVYGCLAWLALRSGELTRMRSMCQTADEHFRANAGRSATEYPFQWLSLLPQLAADMSEDRLEDACIAVQRLLRRSQARLAEPVDQALKAIRQECKALDDTGLARRLAQLVRLATTHRYL